ncbi:Processing alpha glucosidase I [Mortierella sp. GBA43]|nr:Processing alpha glucosidase I [Mortierella sp. GBA43]
MSSSRPRSKSRLSFISTALFGIIALGFLPHGIMATDPSLNAANSFQDNFRYAAGAGQGSLEDASHAAAAAQNQSLQWGIYRPNLYFGTRPRLPNTVMTGLMWFGTQYEDESEINIRHECQVSDGFEKYGWLKADGRTFGIQQLRDTSNNVEIKTDFIKVPSGDHGGSWGARISGKPIDEGKPMTIAALYYIGIDGEGHLTLDNFGVQSPVTLEGSAKDLGEFEFVLEKSAIPQAILPDFIEGDSNVLILQMHYDSEFEFEVRYSSKSSPNPVTTNVISTELAKAVEAFDERFENVFHLKQNGYDEPMVNFAKATMSNLIGGIGYFYGTTIVDESEPYEDGEHEELDGPVARRPDPSPRYTPPATLFSAVPSRSFFPRGFYWDEGFHQTLIGQWDNDLSLEIIESWFNRQDANGWIQREQILGDEARSRVPGQFQIQYPEHANPPTLFKAINLYLDRLRNVSQAHSVGAHGNSEQTALKPDVTNTRLLNSALAAEYLAKLYPKLKANYDWMRRTMRGGIREYDRPARSPLEGYRWRGGTQTHTLTSGLDDYPRAQPRSVGELHVDLLSWIGYMNRNLQSIAAIVGEEDDVEDLEDHYKDIVANVDDLHWSDDYKAYCDLSTDEDQGSFHVCHKGYISLFPMLLGIVNPESKNLDHILDLMYDPEELWTPFGLRSLSKSDIFFAKDENYWRGPVWININYLALHSLKTNYLEKGPYKEKAKKIFNELRDNVIRNIYNEYVRTGYVWEQYNEATGQGKGSHPFTGWTSMVVLLMQMNRAE